MPHLHVAEEQRGRDDAEERRQIVRRHAHNVHGFTRLLELLDVVDAGHRLAAVRHEAVRLDILQNELLCETKQK